MNGDRLTISEAAAAAGVHRNTVRNWVKSGKLDTAHLEDSAGGEVWRIDRAELDAKGLLAEAVEEASEPKGVADPPPAVVATPEPPPAAPQSPPVEPEPPKWAMELLSRADARTESLLDRLRQAEEERADAQRDARVAEHKLETARAAAEELKAERDRLRRQLDGTPEPPEPEPESIEEEGEPEPEPPSAGWWTRRPGHVVAAAKRLPWWKRPYIRSRRGN